MEKRQVKMIHEILELASKAKTKAEKKQVLLKHNSMGLRDMMRGVFDDVIQWNLPEGHPPYKKDNKDFDYQLLQRKSTSLALFVKGNPASTRMLPVKREKAFMDMLEKCHPKEAELLLMVKDKKLVGYKGITKKLIMETWPGLITK